MATPASGAISMSEMRSEITRGTGAISMSEVRTRYGGSGAISFNELYACEGFVITSGSYSSKFVSYTGYNALSATGSVSPAESNSRVQFATTSFLNAMTTTIYTGVSFAEIANNNAGNLGAPQAGWRGSDVIRVVTANVSRSFDTTTIGPATNNNFYYAYTWPASGSIHCLLKF